MTYRPSPSVWLRLLAASAASAAGACAHPGHHYDDPYPDFDEHRVTTYDQLRLPPYEVSQERSVVVHGAPPPLRREVQADRARPSPRHVWVDGHWRPEGRHFVWVPGEWVVPPQGRGRWMAPRYERRGEQHVYVEGRWL